MVSRGYPSLWCKGFSLWWLLLFQSTGSRCELSSCSRWVSVLHGMWGPRRLDIKPMSPALARRFPTTGPLEKPSIQVLFLIIQEKLLAFHQQYDVSCRLVKYDPDYIEIRSLSTYFVQSFYYKWMLNVIKCFSYIQWDDNMIFILHFVNVVNHSYWLPCVEPSSHCMSKSPFIMVYDTCNTLFNLAC